MGVSVTKRAYWKAVTVLRCRLHRSPLPRRHPMSKFRTLAAALLIINACSAYAAPAVITTITTIIETTSRTQVENPIGEGWHLAQSLEGGFTVEMPGPFDDISTAGGGPGRSHTLMASDTANARYMAGLIAHDKRVEQQFDEELEFATTGQTTYQGYPALRNQMGTSGDDNQWDMTVLRVKTPDGVYVLSVAATPERERNQQMPPLERFFSSLKMAAGKLAPTQ